VTAIPAMVEPAKLRGAVWESLHSRRTQVGLVLCGLVILLALIGPYVAPRSTTDFIDAPFAKPSANAPFGTDYVGRDVLSRFLAGGQNVLLLAVLATVITIVGGTTVALIAGYSHRTGDEVLMRLADLTLGLPVILVGLVFVAAFGPSTLNLVLILGILFAPATARLARSALLSELEADYYLAAVSVGAPTWRILLEELLPNTLPVLLARASLVAADAIFVEASLSFVGLGVQPPAASWGTLLHTGYTNLYTSYWYPIFPGLVIVIAVLSLNVLGDNIQRALDPARR